MPTRTYVIISYESNNKTVDFTVHVLFESTRVLDPYLLKALFYKIIKLKTFYR